VGMRARVCMCVRERERERERVCARLVHAACDCFPIGDLQRRV